MHDYQESVTDGRMDRQTPDKVIPICHYASQATQKQTDGQTDAGQSDPYVPLCFAGNKKKLIIPSLALLFSDNIRRAR